MRTPEHKPVRVRVASVAVECPHCNTRLVNEHGQNHDENVYAPPGNVRCPQCKGRIAFPNLMPVWCNSELILAALREDFALPDGTVIPAQGEPAKKQESFTNAQVRLFVEHAKVWTAGMEGWGFLGHQMQEQIVLAKAALIFAEQDERSKFTSADVQNLISRMLKAAGLEDA